MPSLHGSLRMLVAVAVALSTLACSDCPDATPSTYTLDLSMVQGGLHDANSSIAFPIDASAPVKHITEPSPSQIIEIYDRAGCWSGSEHLLESNAIVNHLPGGDAACVRSIDVVLDGTEHDGACYGYRALDGTWHYDLTPIDSTPDASGETQTVHIPVMGGPMDALGLAFPGNYPPNIREIRFEAVPVDR